MLGSNVHVIFWQDPNNLPGTYHLVGTGENFLSSVLLFRDQDVVDMLDKFFIDSNGDWRCVKFFYDGIGGLGFREGYVQRNLAEASASFAVSDWTVPDCNCTAPTCNYNSEALNVTELDCYYPLCSNLVVWTQQLAITTLE